MKKLLLATTALAMSAGVAAADVNVVGDGRMGIVYDDAAANEWRFDSRLRARFNMSGTTDTGLTFGGWFRAQTAPDAASGNMGTGGGNVFIAGAFGRLAMGDVAGAVQNAVGDLHQTSLTGLGFNNENTFFQRNFNGGAFNTGSTNALYTYSIAGFDIGASISQINTGAGEVYGIGIGYNLDGLSIGLGYEIFNTTGPNPNHIAVGAGYDFGIAEVKATYGRVNNATGTPRRDQFGISASGSFDATTVSAYARRDFFDVTHMGIGAAYSLGGGASLTGGVGYSDFPTAMGGGDRLRADFGVSMSF